jgi:hypothetical protein
MGSQELDVVYSLLRAAAAQKQPVTGCRGCYAHTCWGRTSEVSCEHSAIRVEERGKASPDVAGGCGRLALYRRG